MNQNFEQKRKLAMRWIRHGVTSALVALVVLMSNGRASAQPETHEPFNEFKAKTAAAAFRPSTGRVANAQAFEEMRQHVLKMYEGVSVTHSFTVGSQTYDCIPIDQQPAVRLLSLKGIAAPPPASAAPVSAAAGVNNGDQELEQPAVASIFPSGVDRFGNAIGCQDNTVPIGRTTLEQISRFPTLQDFLRKSPDGKGKAPVPMTPDAGGAAAGSIDEHVAPDEFIPPSPVEHKHNAEYQWVNNLGGNSNLSINNPSVYTPWGEVFSLSQVWYIGFSGGATQTVEAGWQVYPDRLWDSQPHLFAYYTADGYNHTGCYDYGCGAFVQYSPSLFLGATVGPASVPGGAQYEVPIQWEFWYGNWWLQVNGTWVGYYPGWLFGGGDMATHSVLIEFGGEIVGGNGTSYNYYPPMGSGDWGTWGWPWAAFQRRIWYFDGSYNGQWTSLPGSINTCPGGTSVSGPSWGGDDWGIYFFFGGPGGWC
jgi:hypothetical protein